MLNEGYMFGSVHLVLTAKWSRFKKVESAKNSMHQNRLALMGRDVFNSMKYIDFLDMADIYGVEIPTDKRDLSKFHAHNYVVSESYILDGIEFGADSVSKVFAHRVFQAQEPRYEDTAGIVTAVSEDNVDEAPYFVYNTVFSDG